MCSQPPRGEPVPSHLDPAVYKNVDVGNALRVVRPTLGDNAGIALYRLLRLVALEDIIGRGAAGTAYLAGKKLGHSLGLTKLEDFLALCHDLKIGIIKVPVLTDIAHPRRRLRVRDLQRAADRGTSAVPVRGRPDRRRGRGHRQAAHPRHREVTCIGGLGDEACGFELEFR